MRAIIIGAIVILLGLFISLGPQFLFKVCGTAMASSEDADDSCGCAAHAEPEVSSCCTSPVRSLPVCHWTARAEIGVGLLVVALGACMMLFSNPQTRLGLLIGVFFAGIIALFIPHSLIGGCASMNMMCRKVAFPALTAGSIVLLVFSAIVLTSIAMQKHPEKSSIKN